MRIEIWSDVVCPWCYIGKRRLETALNDSEHRDEVEIVWRSYQLDPSAPTTPDQTVAEHLGQKYGGGPAAGRQMIDRVEAVAAEEGLVYRLAEAQRANTLDAHRLLHLAHEEVRVKEVLATDRFADAVEADIRQAAAYGATGVPFFVVDGRYGVSGAQPAEAFAQVLERAWADAHPVLDLVGGPDGGEACGPDGCPV